MNKYSFEDIRKNGLLLYEYKRGSHMYGLNTETSDEDYGGIYLAPAEQLVGLGLDYQSEIHNETNDIMWYELKKFMLLLLKSNPTVLEALYADGDCVLYEHPIMTKIKEQRDVFLTKKCFNGFGEYAVEQIRKCRGLNKKFVNPVTKRLEPLDFVYTFYNQGSSNIKNWLEYRGLKQQYCGLVNIPNMHDVYGCYYDWGNFFLNENIDVDLLLRAINGKAEFDKICLIETKDVVSSLKENDNEETRELYRKKQLYNMAYFIRDTYRIHYDHEFYGWIEKQKPIGYKGIVGEDGLSNELRLSSVSKGEKPICWVSYNQTGYQKHCIDYKNYKDWEKHRNPVRYESNLNKNYDCYLDKETEFLTLNGWKKYDDITTEDLIACFDNEHNIRFEYFINRFSDYYTGDIYTYESRYTRFSITPNHKIYLSPCHRNPKTNFCCHYNNDKDSWKLMTVEEYFKGARSHFFQLNALNNPNKDNNEYDDDFINLLGIFLSEGTFVYDKKDKNKIIAARFSQIEGRCACSIMRNITRYDIREYQYDKRGKGIEITWECRDIEVIKKLAQCNGRFSYEKDIPVYVYSFSKRQFDILLKAMLCGDGTHHKEKGHDVYYTFSEKMAINLHTLLILNGYNAQLYGLYKKYYNNAPSNFKRKDGIIHNSYQIFISNKKTDIYSVINKKKTIGKSDFGWKVSQVKNERIVCFETEYGTLVTRNRNKMAFHGNSKNVSHAFRLIAMCTEIAQGKGFNVNRRNIDRDFLLDVKNHKYEYDDVIKMLDEKKRIMDDAISKSTLPEDIDANVVNDLLINIRKEQLKLC